jgi:hypothetical protein
MPHPDSPLVGVAHPYSDKLWAVTCYFNPVGYKRRLQNYYTFRQHLGVPLLTVELSFDGGFQLRDVDADILVQLQGQDVMWQKERLLNVGLESLPDDGDCVAWLDCDVVFEDTGWATRTIQALDYFPLLRLFQKRHDLPPGEKLGGGPEDRPRPGVSHDEIAAGESACAPFGAAAPLPGHNSPGLAWAARRDLLESHHLYDACILGTGDRAILCAALGEFDYLTQKLRMNTKRVDHYLEWAKPFFQAVNGRVGFLPGRLFHLWHGDRNDRDYVERQGLLERFHFDPYTDIAVDYSGCWRWNSNKAVLHESVRRYFQSRREDADPEPSSPLTQSQNFAP